MAKDRSPNYPTMALREALEVARTMYKACGRSAVHAVVAAKAWGHDTMSGAARAKLAAVRHYGLIEGKKDAVKVSPRMLRLVAHQPADREYQDAIREAALEPDLFKTLFERFRGASDNGIRAFLIAQEGYSEGGAKAALKAFRDTIEFADLNSASYTAPSKQEDGDSGDNGGDSWRPQVGDFAQWESQGSFQFDAPRRVRAISDDGGFVFVDGAETGIPSDQLVKSDPPPPTRFHKPPAGRPPMKQGMNQEVFTLEEGEAVLQLPSRLSAESFEDLETWLRLILKKAKRVVTKPSESGQEATD